MAQAGNSAGDESKRLRATADEHDRLAAEARALAGRLAIASTTEKRVATKLAPLMAAGYYFLHDRGWPGARSRAQIDHVLVGPGGLFIVDTKAWAEVIIAGGRIFRGQDDVTDDLMRLADVGYGTEAVMADLGLSPLAVQVLVVLAGRDDPPTQVGSVTVMGERRAASYINKRGRRLSDVEIEAVFDAVRAHFPVLGATPTIIDASAVPAPVAATDTEPFFTVDEVTAILLDGMEAEPIESWMAFLHPAQARLVRRSFNGPSRIRGAAGTGKTVVGLHRAAYLARSQPREVLVTSFVKTLPAVLSTLMQRLAPEVSDRVQFVGVHAFAKRLLAERGIWVDVNAISAKFAFSTVWRQHGFNGPLHDIDRNQRYWQDEISSVIKGRGLRSFDDYANLTRTGRKRPLNLDQRRSVWELYVAYQEELRSRGICDFDDVILRAEASLREYPLGRYGAVVIDEAQDLTCAMIRMLHLLVGDAPDGLTLIGDGQQSIYPGGFTLAEAGISLSGRGVVMTTNYRNTREIVDFAAHQVEGDQFSDIEGETLRKDGISDITRSGPAPQLMRFSSRVDHDAQLLAELQDERFAFSDVGILSATRAGVAETKRFLARHGIRAVDLENYRGVAVDGVKVGTIKRAKGLEFKKVFLPRVPRTWVDEARLDDELHTLHRRELYVGMTRARDELWVGICT
jgi:hypothetical protein